MVFEQIMVPLDGSALAKRALPSVLRLAATAGATIHLVRAVEPPLAPARLCSPINLYNTYMADEIRTTRACLATDGVPVEVCVLTGGPWYALPHYEGTVGINLVVMCSHGRGGAARGSVADHLLCWALGSVADQVARDGATAVLLGRAGMMDRRQGRGLAQGQEEGDRQRVASLLAGTGG